MPRALISVHDKHGVAEFAQGLAELGWELVSSGGTAAHLEERGVEVTTVEEVTQAPEMLGGRVKTLHPRIHAGILARRNLDEDVQTLAAHEIEPFDLVCVNLYPFAAVAARRSATEAEVVEMIDVGGPSMLRAAAKNSPTSPRSRAESQYESVLAALREHGELPLDMKRDLARDAFAATAAYESAIATWFAETESFPDQLDAHLPQGDEPRVRREPTPGGGLLPRSRHAPPPALPRRPARRQGALVNNLVDLEAGRRLLREFVLPAVVIVKHANPCGVAVAGTIEEAWERALTADPVSAFGCVALLNRPVFAELGARIAGHFVEVLMAPGFDDAATDVLRAKQALRLLWSHDRRGETPGERDTSACSEACWCRTATSRPKSARP